MQSDFDIHTIDTGFHRPHFDAAYLVVDEGVAALVDSGINASLPMVLATLAQRRLTVDDVRYLILTHVHLDHAGGAGQLMQCLPKATLIVHARGARHMIDPTALIAGASAVYGRDEVERTYGHLVAVQPERIQTVTDGERIRIGRRELEVFDAPGHARHHIVVHDPAAAAFFTGDTFGLSYREFDTAQGPWIMPTTTPVQFEPEPMKQSIARMMRASPERMYLTHYGRVEAPQRLAALLVAQIDTMVEIAQASNRRYSGSDRHKAICEGLTRLYLDGLAAHGVGLGEDAVRSLLAMDIELNAQGLASWLDRAR
ncbi:MAG TPA: MBL fold metallo-hydrolase [Aquimonas sp.]|nr:MBL fold metallo-hydrolase [Xanthomonadales bacterium]HRD72097.1 MBL fold metallo-hydrolase [Aquimonas sp.]HRF54290.1 MBL fold metallo-hydrolase [Aquimonas sp.]